jgi:hypothetical protein
MRVLVVIASVLVGVFVSVCGAQTIITTNPPTASDAKHYLQGKIDREAEGRIRIVNFRSTFSTPAAFKVGDETRWTVEFEAEIEFTEPCEWIWRVQGQPVTFRTLKSGTLTAVPGESIEVRKPTEQFTIRGVVVFRSGNGVWAVFDFRFTDPPENSVDLQVSRACMVKLKQIGLSYRNWAERHNNQFPFNISTNSGGSKELGWPDKDGFEQHPEIQFRFLARGLVGYDYGTFTPTILVCPAETNRQPAQSFQMLQPSNVSYQLHCGTNDLNSLPPGVLARCPVHGWTLYTDDSILKPRPNQ